ncbi:major facilitator superfamily domain-containing protein [Stachybotrys elegans]|uniref:Major facilitator superfamily domain-containing protein n=1 Tax=Stachybotrys elegans TaxID=80388 RepID=A0A8K0SUE9_9HYPO|nr:major facilitator superfamily domain-containing protein [Stachybotrys elegans]
MAEETTRLLRTPTSSTSSTSSSSSASSGTSISPARRAVLFASIFLASYAYGLESQVRGTYQPYATSAFGLHSSLATLNVLRSVVAAASQPTASKLADVFGRLNVLVAASSLYTLGIAIEAVANSVPVFFVGAIIYQFGFTCIVLLMEVLIADYSSMRARVFFSYLPALPFLINTWLSGVVTEAVLTHATWRLGIGMWALIYPICSMPLFISLASIERQQAVDADADCKSLVLQDAIPTSVTELFHSLDVIGLIFLISAFSLVLAPLTRIGGTSSHGHWNDPTILVPLVLGLFCVPAFVIWERRGARTPLVPFHLLGDRGVWASLAVRTLLNCAWYTQANFLFTILIVAFDFPIEAATRILSFYSFFGVFSGVAIGLLIYKIRRLRLIIIIGTILFMLAFALLIMHPGGASASAQSGMMGAQILLGLSAGLFAYPTQASIQASAAREYVAILTGLYLAMYNVGGALGTSLAGAIWSQTLYPALEANLAFQPNATLAAAVYNSPFDTIVHYPVGTEIRDAIITSYQGVQQLLCTAGLLLCIPMIAFAFALRNPHLSDH